MNEKKVYTLFVRKDRFIPICYETKEEAEKRAEEYLTQGYKVKILEEYI